ncbi:MAG: hypothetical protein V1899_08620 [Planctomycetota bacterium]
MFFKKHRNFKVCHPSQNLPPKETFFPSIRNQKSKIYNFILLLSFSFVGLVWAEAPALPKDVEPLPANIAEQMRELRSATEEYRGLKFKHPIPCGTLNEEALKKKMIEAFQEELPPEKMQPLEISLKTFGLIPEQMNLSKYFPELLTSQVGGFYDPKRQYLVIVQREGGLLGDALKKKFGLALAQRMEEMVLIHELTHGLQDQFFNLQKFAETHPLSDESAARMALVEGDATLIMYNFMYQMKMENMPGVEQILKQALKDPKQLIELMPDMPGSKELGEAPAWVRDTLLFSYLQGYLFCLNIKKLGGQKLMDYSFAKDPPRSTEQILHPEKWHARRDDPVAIIWPDLTQQLPGYKKVAEAQMGESGIKILLQDLLKDEQIAATAAAGWGGDRFAIYEKDGRRVLTWLTEWDAEQDSQEFKAAISALGADWKANQCAPKRVMVIRGKLADAERAAVKVQLTAAKATYPENKNIDLSAFGAENKKDGEDFDLVDMAQKLLVNTPSEGGLDLNDLLNNPQVQDLLKGMLKQEQSAGQTSDDGRAYTNAELGMSFKLPALQKDWKMNPKPNIPMTLLTINSPDDSVVISVVSQTPPLMLEIENIGPMLEMGLQLVFKDFKKLSGNMVGNGPKKGYELQYECTLGGMRRRLAQHCYTQGQKLIVISAATSSEKWAKNETAIFEILNSFIISAPQLEKNR